MAASEGPVRSRTAHQQRVAAHNRGWATVWAAVRDGRVLFGVSGDGLQRIWMRIPVGVRRPLVAGAPSQHINSAKCRFEYDTNTRMAACCRAPSDGHSRRRNEACVYALPTTTWVQLVGHEQTYCSGRCFAFLKTTAEMYKPAKVQ